MLNKIMILCTKPKSLLTSTLRMKLNGRRSNYIGTGTFLSNGQEKKKFALITKETPPHELYHSFMAKWQHEQMDNLLELSPLTKIACVQRAIVADSRTKFNQNTLMLHRFLFIFLSCITLQLNMLMERKAQKNLLLSKNISLISNDVTQDCDSKNKAQELTDKYRKDEIKVPVNKVHEFTDGCVARYKSKQFLGDLSSCLSDFGYRVNRNYSILRGTRCCWGKCETEGKPSSSSKDSHHLKWKGHARVSEQQLYNSSSDNLLQQNQIK